MTTVTAFNPAAACLRLEGVPREHLGGIGYANQVALSNALTALPAISDPSVTQIGRALSRTVELSKLGYCADVGGLEFDDGVPSNLRGFADRVAHVRTAVLPNIAAALQQSDRWEHIVEKGQSLFGDRDIFNTPARLRVIHRQRAVATVPDLSAPESAPPQTLMADEYVLEAHQVDAEGRPVSDRLTTSLAVLLGLDRGVVGTSIAIGIDDTRLGFGGSATETYSLPLQTILFFISPLLADGWTDAEKIASAFHMGIRHLGHIEETPDCFGTAVFFAGALNMSEDETLPVNVGIELINLSPEDTHVTAVKNPLVHESGQLYVRKKDPAQPAGIRIIFAPKSGITFLKPHARQLQAAAMAAYRAIEAGLVMVSGKAEGVPMR
ncbi:MAG: hypothetical protein HQM16_04770 [Deltaproteobacteria bacterium]|nr:hypothetical protein [Deltaproteobacteria bacterium]